MSGVNVNVMVANEHLGPTVDAIAIKHGGRPVGSSGKLRSVAVPAETLEAFCKEAEQDVNVTSVQTNPPEARRNLKKTTAEGRNELLREAEPKESMITHIEYCADRSQRMDITDIRGFVYENVEHDFKFKDGISIVYEQSRYYLPLTSILSIKIRNPGS